MVFLLCAVARVGFVEQTWRVSEDTREATLLVESDGRNVDPVVLKYFFQSASETAEGSIPSYIITCC